MGVEVNDQDDALRAPEGPGRRWPPGWYPVGGEVRWWTGNSWASSPTPMPYAASTPSASPAPQQESWRSMPPPSPHGDSRAAASAPGSPTGGPDRGWSGLPKNHRKTIVIAGAATVVALLLISGLVVALNDESTSESEPATHTISAFIGYTTLLCDDFPESPAAEVRDGQGDVIGSVAKGTSSCDPSDSGTAQYTIDIKVEDADQYVVFYRNPVTGGLSDFGYASKSDLQSNDWNYPVT